MPSHTHTHFIYRRKDKKDLTKAEKGGGGGGANKFIDRIPYTFILWHVT